MHELPDEAGLAKVLLPYIAEILEDFSVGQNDSYLDCIYAIKEELDDEGLLGGLAEADIEKIVDELMADRRVQDILRAGVEDIVGAMASPDMFSKE
jgi:hypothetical protein